MHTLQKSKVGAFPEPELPRGVDPKVEDRKARRRLYPVTVVYTVLFVVLFILGMRSPHPGLALLFVVLGIIVFTPVEYLIHRYLLHGVFPPGGGRVARGLHRLLDASHVDHHARPWDGMYINGHYDTLFPAVVMVPLSFLTPYYTGPLFVATLFACYTAEEWLHHAMHFYNYRNPYFRYVRTHHLYHHSRQGAGLAYGITSGIWDVILATRDRTPDRPVISPRPRGDEGGTTSTPLSGHGA